MHDEEVVDFLDLQVGWHCQDVKVKDAARLVDGTVGLKKTTNYDYLRNYLPLLSTNIELWPTLGAIWGNERMY